MSNPKQDRGPDDPFYRAPLRLGELNDPTDAATGEHGKDKNVSSAPHTPDENVAHFPIRGLDPRSQKQPDFFAEAVARAEQEQFEPGLVEVPSFPRNRHSFGRFAVVVTGAAVVALVFVLAYPTSQGPVEDNAASALPTWERLKSSLFPGSVRRPAPTLIVMAISDWFVSKWYIIFPVIIGGIYGFLQAWKRSLAVQIFMDRLMLRMPVFGDLVRKSTIARWTRTLATMFAAGVPLVEALDSVGGASGNYIYMMATKQIQAEVSTGTSLTVAMQNANVFPSMVLQMCSIGEETGALDGMLSKVADFYEAEVDDAVEALSSLMEPMIMVVLGTLIGGMVIAMYLPIFKIGQAV